MGKKRALAVKVRDHNGVHVVSVSGECDMSTAPILKGVIQSLIPSPVEPSTRLIVDLRNLEYMDSSAYWVLAAANKKIMEAGGGIALVAASGQPVFRAIKLLKIDRMMGVFSSPEEACSFLLAGGKAGAGSENHAF